MQGNGNPNHFVHSVSLLAFSWFSLIFTGLLMFSVGIGAIQTLYPQTFLKRLSAWERSEGEYHQGTLAKSNVSRMKIQKSMYINEIKTEMVIAGPAVFAVEQRAAGSRRHFQAPSETSFDDFSIVFNLWHLSFLTLRYWGGWLCRLGPLGYPGNACNTRQPQRVLQPGCF